MSSNPFSTRYTKPGVIAFRFRDSDDDLTETSQVVGQLIDRVFANQPSCWQIIGPHGSGKSTLLHALRAGLASHATVELHTLRDGQRRLPAGWRSSRSCESPIIIVDGYEQLGWFARRRLKRHAQQAEQRLLVTAHQDVGFQTLFETQVDRVTLRNIISQLLVSQPSSSRKALLMSDETIDALLLKYGQNAREMLFELYDAWGK